VSEILAVPPSDNDQAAAALASDLLRETREEVGRADGKASTMLSAVVIVLGLFVAATLSGTWSPLKLELVAAAVWWVGTGLAAAGVILLSVCLYPNVANKATKEMLGYFGHVNQYSSREELIEALRQHGDRPLTRLSDQLFVISRIVRRKYRYMRLAMWSLGGAVSMLSIALLINHLRWL
jgi:Family of unknown function (DUF5706)